MNPKNNSDVCQVIEQFLDLAVELRQKCPWDRQQTHQSLRGHLLEEAYEVLEALDAVSPATLSGYEDLAEELGDLLYQIVFHSLLATEVGQFTFADVTKGIHDKLKARHPHIFGPQTDAAGVDVAGAKTTEDGGVGAQAAQDTSAQDNGTEITKMGAAQNWEAMKREQKGRASVMEGIPVGLPALLFADKVIHKARSVGLEPEVDTPTVAGRLSDAVKDAQSHVLDAYSELRASVNSIGEQTRHREISSM